MLRQLPPEPLREAPPPWTETLMAPGVSPSPPSPPSPPYRQPVDERSMHGVATVPAPRTCIVVVRASPPDDSPEARSRSCADGGATA